MKISVLIDELDKIMNDYGDLVVRIEDPDRYNPITGIYIEETASEERFVYVA